MDKVQIEVVTLAEGVSMSNSFTVLLKEKEGNRKFVIVIGYTEAQAIAISLDQSIKPNRPLTHDLFHRVCESYTIRIVEATIIDLKEGIYYASITCQKGDAIFDFDSRSSDALALALRFNAPIYISKELLEKVSLEDKKEPEQTIEEFEEELEEELKQMEDISIEDIEKEESKSLKDKTISELKLMLDAALKNENYELAAKIRDEISQRNA